MNLLVTAGNTHAPIDRVRVVTNVFTGKTGANLARTAWARGHRVTLLTSHPDTVSDLPDPAADSDRRVTVVPYRTFDDLAGQLQQHVKTGGFDALFHTAAVSDYLSAGVYAPGPGTFFNARTKQWERRGAAPAMTEHHTGGKISSGEPEVWVRMVRAPKLIDRIRAAWGFDGLLVKFKLEAGVTDAELLDRAEKSRVQSGADLVVANTLEAAAHFAYVGPLAGQYERIARRELAERLVLTAERSQRARVLPAE